MGDKLQKKQAGAWVDDPTFKELWHKEAGQWVLTAKAFDYGLFAVISQVGGTVAVKLQRYDNEINLKWEKMLPYADATTPKKIYVTAKNEIFIVTNNSRLTKLDGNGNVVWTFAPSGYAIPLFTVSPEGRVYVGANTTDAEGAITGGHIHEIVDNGDGTASSIRSVKVTSSYTIHDVIQYYNGVIYVHYSNYLYRYNESDFSAAGSTGYYYGVMHDFNPDTGDFIVQSGSYAWKLNLANMSDTTAPNWKFSDGSMGNFMGARVFDGYVYLLAAYFSGGTNNLKQQTKVMKVAVNQATVTATAVWNLLYDDTVDNTVNHGSVGSQYRICADENKLPIAASVFFNDNAYMYQNNLRKLDSAGNVVKQIFPFNFMIMIASTEIPWV